MLDFLKQSQGGQRRFRPDPRLLARASDIHGAALRQGRLDDPGRREEPRIWTPPSQAGQASRRSNGDEQVIDLQLIDYEGRGIQLGNRFFEPGRKNLVQLDLKQGVLLHGGQRIELGLTPSAVHDPTELATVLFGYRNYEMAAPVVVPVIPVDHDQDKWPILNSNLAFLPAQVKTDDDADPHQLPFSRTLTNFTVQVRRVAAWLPDTTMRQVTNAGLNLRYIMMNRAARAIALDIEIDDLGTGGLMTTNTNWNANNRLTLAAGYQWGGPAGIGALSNPIADIRTILNASAMPCNGGIWFNQRLGGIFLDHPKVRDYFRSQNGDRGLSDATKAVMSTPEETVSFSIAGLCDFHIAGAKVSSSSGGAPDFIMPNDIAIAVRSPGGVPMNGEDVGSAATLRRKGPAGVGFYTREVYMSWKGCGGTMIIVEEGSVGVMTSPLTGGIITGAYQ